MRSLQHFSSKDWLQLLPLQHAVKQVRNDAWLALYQRARAPELPSFLERVRHLKSQNIVLVIAFEQPWALDWLLRMSKRCLPDATVLVFDNSRNKQARIAIEQVCAERDAPYLPLPANPTRHGNRSHGMAMQWVYRNVVQAIQPRVFGFIDHDLIPLEPLALSEKMAGQPFYGMPLQRRWAWQLWAGYCFFDAQQVGSLPLNFLYDFSNGLDTGGRNWRHLYRSHDRARLQLAISKVLEIKDPWTGQPRRIQIVDDAWYHIGGISYNDNFATKAEFAQRLAQGIDEGQSWRALLGQAAPAEVAHDPRP